MSLVKTNGNRLNALPMLFDDFFGREFFNWNNSNFSNTSTTIPAVNIKETPEHYEVEVAAPGMTKDLAVCIHGNKVNQGEHYLNTEEFLDSIDVNLRRKTGH